MTLLRKMEEAIMPRGVSSIASVDESLHYYGLILFFAILYFKTLL